MVENKNSPIISLPEKHQLTTRQKLEVFGFEDRYETDAIIRIIKESLKKTLEAYEFGSLTEAAYVTEFVNKFERELSL